MKALCCLGLAGLALLWQNGSAFLTAIEAKTWPTAPGRIEFVHVVTQPRANRDDHDTYLVVAGYTYDVGGARHKGDRLDFRDPLKHEWLAAQQVVLDYPRGEPIAVHYNPRNPEVAIVNVELWGENWVMFGLGLFFTALGIAAAVMLWRARA